MPAMQVTQAADRSAVRWPTDMLLHQRYCHVDTCSFQVDRLSHCQSQRLSPPDANANAVPATDPVAAALAAAAVLCPASVSVKAHRHQLPCCNCCRCISCCWLCSCFLRPSTSSCDTLKPSAQQHWPRTPVERKGELPTVYKA
jgi:hypothetical protein